MNCEKQVKKLREKLQEASEAIKSQQKIINNLEDESGEGEIYKYGTVIFSAGSTSCISINGEIIIIKGSGAFLPGAKVGVSQDGECHRLPDEFPSFGPTRTITKVLEDGMAEVETSEGEMVILTGENEVKEGDRVIVDSNNIICLKNIGKIQSFSISKPPEMTWDDIGGLDSAKEDLIGAIELPEKYPDIFKAYGKKSPKGILLYGPPGCGKTMLAKASAHSLATIHNIQNSSGFIYIKGPEVLRKYVGDSEAIIRAIFKKGKDYYEEYGHPAIMFIDEADSLLSKRGTGISSDIEKTIVPTFLSEMDGLEASGVYVILATNRPDVLDPAVVRDGRIDKKIFVPRPNKEATQIIFNLYIKDRPILNTDLEAIVEKATNEVFSSKRKLFSVITQKGKTIPFCLKDIVNGAMVSNIVENAISLSIKRNIDNKEFENFGITIEDVVKSIDDIFDQNKELKHDDAITELNNSLHKDKIVGITD